MADEYIPRNPGDLITAEDWNELQTKIQQDIVTKVQVGKEEVIKTGVSRADNADKFDQKTPKEWTDELDQRYAPKIHNHEGQTVRFQCFKRFTANTPTTFIYHNLGQFPIVDIYPLAPVPKKVMQSPDIEPSDDKPIKFFLYYHKEEADKFTLKAQVYRQQIELGVPLAAILTEYGVQWQEDDTLEDVRNGLWAKLFSGENDTITYASSPWIKEQIIERSTIKQLINGGEWQDIRLVFLPHKYNVTFAQLNYPQPVGDSLAGGASIQEESVPSYTWPGLIRCDHVNYNTLFLGIASLNNQAPNIPDDSPVDVMVLMRI